MNLINRCFILTLLIKTAYSLFQFNSLNNDAVNRRIGKRKEYNINEAKLTKSDQININSKLILIKLYRKSILPSNYFDHANLAVKSNKTVNEIHKPITNNINNNNNNNNKNILEKKFSNIKHFSKRETKIPHYFKKFQHLQFDENESHQFCGETLFYAVEYYCVHIKGTSVYTPDYNFENTNVYDEQKKSKRNIINNSVDNEIGNIKENILL